MKNKVRRKEGLCAICGGELRPATITHEERRGSNLYLFQNVPAKICPDCGEIWVEELTLQEIDRLIKSGRPVSKLETPVYDFALTEAK